MDKDRIVGETKVVGGKLESAVGKGAADEKTQAEGKATELKGTAENFYGQAKDAVRDLADQASGLAEDALAAGRDRFPEAEKAYRQGAAAVESAAKDSPLGVILVAAAVGYLVAFLIHGRT